MCKSDPNIDEMTKAFELHRSQPEVSFDEHVRNKKIELGRSLEGLKAIYLDTRYWIFIRDALLEKPQHSCHTKLLNLLRELVNQKKIFCPISDVTLVEILKQTDPNSRRALALLVDELSFGISFCPEEERTGTELAHFLYSSIFEKQNLYPLRWLIWTKITNVLSTPQVSVPWVNEVENLVIQKAFFDHLWDVSYSVMIETMGIEKTLPKMPYDELAIKMNTLNQSHSNEVRRYKATYLREFAGALDSKMDVVKDISETIRKKIDKSPVSSDSNNILGKHLFSIFTEAARKELVSEILPTFHINAHCHASIRYDKQRKLNGNDIPDFHHARTALPYCVAFLTENPLKVLLSSGNAKLDKNYSCKIISDSAEALVFVETLF